MPDHRRVKPHHAAPQKYQGPRSPPSSGRVDPCFLAPQGPRPFLLVHSRSAIPSCDHQPTMMVRDDFIHKALKASITSWSKNQGFHKYFFTLSNLAILVGMLIQILVFGVHTHWKFAMFFDGKQKPSYANHTRWIHIECINTSIYVNVCTCLSLYRYS